MTVHISGDDVYLIVSVALAFLAGALLFPKR